MQAKDVRCRVSIAGGLAAALKGNVALQPEVHVRIPARTAAFGCKPTCQYIHSKRLIPRPSFCQTSLPQ